MISQKSIRRFKKSKGIRLDVYVTDDEGNSYDIEMQTTKDLDQQVKMLNNGTDWRDRQMTFEMKLKEYQRQGFEDGLQQGTLQCIELCIEQGHAEGFAEGLQKGLYDTINKMLSKGLTPKEIMNLLECSETDIENAQK